MDNVTCPHCGEVSDIGSLIGSTTDNCPRCGKRALAKYKPYQPKTGQPCSCKRGVERDNCPACEGTGQRIDFAAIRARNAQPKHRDTEA